MPVKETVKRSVLVYVSKELVDISAGTHCFALIQSDGVAVGHGHKSIPPFPIFFQVLKETS